ncbi:ninjurin-1-like, partial [Astyanax mexicanus]
ASHDRHVPPSSLNMNHYANKKSAAESMLDIALLMANASQLKAVLEQGPQFNFYAPLITLISLSLGLQIMVGVLLIFIGKKGLCSFGVLVLINIVLNRFCLFKRPQTDSLWVELGLIMTVYGSSSGS